MAIDLSQFHEVFIEESLEGLQVMESSLMELDCEDVDPEQINTIFRSAHSIKGGAGTFGFTKLSAFTHVLETLLDQVRSNQRTLSLDDINLFLQSVDCMRELIYLIQDGRDEYNETAVDLKKKFECLLEGECATEAASQTRSTENNLPESGLSNSGPEEDAASSTLDERVSVANEKGLSTWVINFVPHQNILHTGNDPLRLVRELKQLGELNVTQDNSLPSFTNLDPELCYLSWTFELTSECSRDDITTVFEWVEDDSDIDIHLSDQKPQGWRVHFVPSDSLLNTGNDPLKLFRELTALADEYSIVQYSSIPDLHSFEPEICSFSWTIDLLTTCEEAAIENVFEWVEDLAEIKIQPLYSTTSLERNSSTSGHLDSNGSGDANTGGALPENNVVQIANHVSEGSTSQESQINETPEKVAQKKAQAKSNQRTAKATSTETSSIRVGIDKIDNLINMVGELVITQSMLGQVGTNFDASQTSKLLEGLSQLEQNTRELQECVMKIRMLPISFAFSRFPRMVRDLGQTLGKNVHLEMRGETTELDKTVMEKIGDPLVHLVRNAIDHGIETPDERIEKGKSDVGNILLNAYHQGGNVVIEIQDDGRGLDTQRIKEKAISNGVITQTEAEVMPESAANELIFHPGLSTAKSVSDVSGRGVGMDVVKRNIQALNGVIEIDSTLGSGSTITVKLPLTLAILDGQLIRVGESTFVSPLISIVESIQLREEQKYHVAGGCDVFQLREEFVPIVHLGHTFSINSDRGSDDVSLVVVVESDGSKVGIVVDELLSQQQVVIKSLEDNYRRVEGVSGATILGDGTVALILDMPGIVKIAGEKFNIAQNYAVSKTLTLHSGSVMAS